MTATDSTRHHLGTVLVCDDETGFRGMVADVLAEQGHQVLLAGSVREGRDLLVELTPDLLVLDLRLPDGSGIDLLRELRAIAPGCLCLIVTANASVGTAVEALRLGAQDYLEKPVQLDDLVAKVALLLRHRAVMRENAVLRGAVNATSGEICAANAGPAMRALVDQAGRFAERGRIALLCGESGSGKEVVARYIHRRAGAGDPFVPVNLAALPESIAEAQLFGHVRGAFTGAHGASEGLARAAAGGTLFLDEVTESPPAVQAKLLRLVDHSEILPVGATQPIRVQFRLLAATNRDIVAEVASGRFREDLYHRLNVVSFTLPPLRERRDEIPGLARLLLDALAIERGLPAPEFQPAALRALLAYRWPGNVRELRNVLERALILGSGDALSAADLPADLLGATVAVSSDGDDLRGAVAAFERAHIEHVLNTCDGDRKRAAGRLGIGLATLYRKLETHADGSGASPASEK